MADQMQTAADGTQQETTPPAGALSGYRAGISVRRDESFDSRGRPKAPWRAFHDWMERSGPQELDHAARELARLRDESGVAFTSRAQPGDGAADPIPVILAADDWGRLEAGLEQRGRLAEAVLQDIYGPRESIRAGILPPGLIFGTGAFAAHMAAAPGPGQQRPRLTYVYEADVARSADGRWIVLADRLDAPLGDGWLIANRIATSQALSEPFVELGVRRLASHFARFQELLDSMTGWEGRLALLTGGERDPRFFSHAYLARYLNATLVEPADLTVRDEAAFVKTLSGLKKVDVLLRGAADRAVDALHLPQQAAPGAPALSLAARSGQLVLANGIGASVMAYRALAPFAHLLSRYLLDEELLIDDAPCLWLGTPDAREQVLSELPFWRIEPVIGRRFDKAPRLPDPDDGEGRDALARLLERSGERYAAVATPPLATTPVWSGVDLAPREWMMRSFASWVGESWSVAPGGVAATVEPGCPPPALGFGKDVWILPADDSPHTEAAAISKLADRLQDAHLRRTGRDLLSRVADEVFWLGRNAERAESTLRMLSVCVARFLSGNRIDADPAMLCDLVSAKTKLKADLPPKAAFREAVVRLLTDPDEPLGLPATLGALRSGAVRARMSISDESWRHIDRLSSDTRWRMPMDLRASAEIVRLIEDSLRNLSALAGSAQENLTRNFAWRFLEMGRRIERGTQIAKLAHLIAGQPRPNEESRLRAWLMYSDSSSAYRSRYMMVPTAAAVMDLLILDEANPRALAYQMAQLESVLASLPTDVPYRRAEHRKALALLTDLRLVDADALAASDRHGARPALAALSARCAEDLAEISTLLGQAFFAHADAPVALVSQARLEGRAGLGGEDQ